MEINVFNLSADEYDIVSDIIPADIMADKRVNYLCAVDGEGNALGILAFRVVNAIVELVYIRVYKAVSEDGVEKALLDDLIRRVDETGKLYNITSVFPNNGTYSHMYKALEENDQFMLTESDRLYFLKPEDRKNFKLYQKVKDTLGKTVLFSEIDRIYKKKFYQYLIQNEIELTLPDDEPELENELSVCTLDSAGEIAACVFFKKKDDTELELSFMMIKPGRERDMVILLSDILRKLEDKYPDVIVTIDAVNEKSQNLVEKLFFNAVTVETIYTAIRL